MKKIYLLLLVCFIALFNSNTYAQNKQGVLRILAIGNSFSEDALENYLYELAKAENKQIIIGNMYIGGASIELHVNNSKANKAVYSYRKVGLDGKKVTTKDVSIEKAIKDEPWDYISLQQASPLSGQYEVIMKGLPSLIEYVNKQKAAHTKLVYHSTWAYQKDSNHKGFANYNNDQYKMYSQIVDVSRKIRKNKAFTFVTPAGTAIQNARTSSIGDRFTRDGYHLELTYGRFTAACTWFEKLYGLDVRKNSFKPASISDLQAKIAKEAAHQAVRRPYKISKIKY